MKLALLLLVSMLDGSPAEPLPQLKGEYLTGRKATLPSDVKGKTTLLALGFTHESEHAVEDWVKRFRKDFGTNPNVTVLEIPMIGGMGQIAKPFIDAGMRKGTPREDYEHVVTVYGGVDPWKKRLGVTDGKFAYLILLDREGRIGWRHNGMFDEKVYAELASAVRRLTD